MVRAFCVALLWALLAPLTAWAASQEAVYGSRGMVVSRSELASHVGVEIMKSGGNAIDAAVATGFALAVTYPSAGNLGGGGFMVIRLQDGTVISNDHREVAPAAARRDMYLDDAGNVIKGLSTDSHLAVGVPGTVAGLLDVHARFGRLPREKVIEPAVRLAREGFVLSFDLARQFAEERAGMQAYPASMEVFFKGEALYQAGDRWQQPDLADTLEQIAKKGRDGFYGGKVADALVAEMQAHQGLITHQDLAAYQSRWREPIRGEYRGYEIYTMPPPSSGGVLLVQILNMLRPYDLKSLGFGSAASMHLMIEAERRAYADRAEHLGDPDFFPVPVATLTSPSYAAERFKDFDPLRASLSDKISAGAVAYESPETTHASVVDGEGNAVAYTTTLNLGYGAKIVVPGAGFLLNNEMDDFSVKPNTPNSFGLLGRVANEIQPKKRMLSSMTPTIVSKDGKVVLVTGSPGGSTIITTVLQVIVNSLDHGMDISQAVGSPRFHHQWQPNRVILEPYGFSPDTIKTLESMGHQNLIAPRFGRGIGDANSIALVNGQLMGMSDPRSDGGAAGY